MTNQNQSPKTIKLFDRDELILGRLDDLKDEMRELKTEMREINARADKLESEVHNSSRHSRMMSANVVGIALAVFYFVFTH